MTVYVIGVVMAGGFLIWFAARSRASAQAARDKAERQRRREMLWAQCAQEWIETLEDTRELRDANQTQDSEGSA